MSDWDREPIADQSDDALHTEELRLSDWLWRPWYAKLWWALIPLYWLAVGEPTRPTVLNAFAESGYAVLTNIVFSPFTALVVLGAGFFRRAAELGELDVEFGGVGRRDIDEYSNISHRGINRFRNAVMRDQRKG